MREALTRRCSQEGESMREAVGAEKEGDTGREKIIKEEKKEDEDDVDNLG